MNWFVKLANYEIEKMTSGEIMLLQEEISALATELFRRVNHKPYTIEQLTALRDKVRKYLLALANTGQVNVLGLRISLWVVNPQKALGKPVDAGLSALTAGSGSMITWLVPTTADEGFLYYMCQMLGTYGRSILKCLHCGKLFLQFRTTARYCSRDCQSRAYMRAKRAGDKEE